MGEPNYAKVFRSRAKGALMRKQVREMMDDPNHRIFFGVNEREPALLCDYCRTDNFDDIHKQCKNCGASGVHRVLNSKRYYLRIQNAFGSIDV